MDLSVVREEIKSSIKVNDWIGTNRRVDCPEPDCDGKGRKADCQPYDSGWYCFVCKTSGDIFKWVMLTRDCNFMTALRTLADAAGICLEPNPERSALLEKFMYHALDYSNKHKLCMGYMLNNRSIDLDTLRSHGVGYCDLGGEVLENSGLTLQQLINLGIAYQSPEGIINYLGGRYLFPIRNVNGQIISIKGRANPIDIPSLDPRRKSMPLKSDGPWGRHSHMDCLYLEENIRHYKDYVFVCEGEPDTLTLRSWGINALGMMTNTGISKHFNKLKQFSRIYFALDNDENTQKHIISELYNLQIKIPDTVIYNVTLPKGDNSKKLDVNDFKVAGHSKRDFHNLAMDSPEASELIIKSWCHKLGVDKTYSAKLYALIGSMPSRREKLLDLMSSLTNVPVDMLAFAVDTTT